LKPKLAASPTKHLPLIGAHGYTDNMYLKLIQQYGLETEVAMHLARSYGDRAFLVASLSQNTGKRWPIHGTRLVSWYPYIEGEVVYAVKHEYALTAVDVLARRMRLAFLSCQASVDALPRVIEIMKQELNWDSNRAQTEYNQAITFLKAMGLEDTSRARAEFSDAELKEYNMIFKQNDPYDCGRINKEQIVDILYRLDNSITPFEWKKIIKTVDTFNTDTFTFNDLLEAISTGRNNMTFKKENISGKALSKAPERSGGSV
jgi:glycerol-3-phosphate dehydrogenase